MLKFMNKVAHSYWYDLLGIAIVIGGCAVMGYFSETMSITPAWKSGSAFVHLFPAGLMIGLISVISALFSLESDRFESRLSNVGNWIGIPSILLTMFVDVAFGNRAAWLTYPVTMLIQIIAVYVWHHKDQYDVTEMSRTKFSLYLLVAIVGSFAFSYWTDWIGFGAADAHGMIFWTTTSAFAVSLIANLAEMLKLQFNNKAWVVYNLVQLAKALAQGNLANVFKIVYYLGNNAVSIVSWSAKGRAISSKETAAKV